MLMGVSAAKINNAVFSLTGAMRAGGTAAVSAALIPVMPLLLAWLNALHGIGQALFVVGCIGSAYVAGKFASAYILGQGINISWNGLTVC